MVADVQTNSMQCQRTNATAYSKGRETYNLIDGVMRYSKVGLEKETVEVINLN